MHLSAATFAGLFILPLLAAAASPGPHIADLNVLLPPLLSSPVSYRLQGSDGCFSWSWDHHDILHVKPEYNDSSGCSMSARLTSIAPFSPKRKETAIYATDRRTGITIRCKVFIDCISRIQIVHHAVKIDLEELATLRIRAFDDEDNEFSSLVGLRFLWQLQPKASDSSTHLVHVPLIETPLSDCGGFCGNLDTQIELENKGFGSDLYVVRGVEIGHDVVSAQLLEPQFDHVRDKIVLTVAEAMSLDPPSPVFVTIGALIYYSLRVVHQNTPKVVDLPSRHHFWSATNSTVAQVDNNMGIVNALSIGITNIVVEDTRLSGHEQTSCMHVVTPEKLLLYIVPVSSSYNPLQQAQPIPSSVIWYVFPGQEYIVHIQVFSEEPDAKEIYITESNNLKLESSSRKYWDLSPLTDEVSVNYDRRKSRLLKPISEGTGFLTGSINYLSGDKENLEVLKLTQEVIVCSKVKFSFGVTNEFIQVVRLPWAPGVHQEVELSAIGGCGRNMEDYIWFSSDETVVYVSSGLLHTRGPGHAIIKVVSIFDSNNYDEVAVEVSIPSSMIMLPNLPVETVIGTQLETAVTLKTSDGEQYFRCDAFNLFVKWKLFSENETFRILDSTTVKSFSAVFSNLGIQPCAWKYLHASASGRAMLHATLSTELQASSQLKDGPINLKAVSSIAAYSPLVVHQAKNGNQFGGYFVDDTQYTHSIGLLDLYLVPGSSMDLFLVGGPEQWDLNIDHIEKAEITSEEKSIKDGVLLQQASFSGKKLYTVLCQRLGKYKLLFSRANIGGESYTVPAIAYAELFVICSFPSTIIVIANEPANTLSIIDAATKADRSPGRIRTAPVIVANGCTIRIAAVGIHTNGRAFANSSSLALKWELNECYELAHWMENQSHKSSLESAWERFLVLHNASGLCTIRATVSGLSKAMSGHVEKEYLLGRENSLLTDAMRIQLVSTLRIIPESVLLVYYPEAKVDLSVTGGTCYLDAMINDTKIAQLSQPLETVECSRLVLSAGGLGTALVTVRDIGLSPPVAASALVKVANVDWIKIVSDEDISLMEGTARSFDILVGTKDGFVFDYSQYRYMNMQVHIDDSILVPVDAKDASKLGGWIISSSQISVRAKMLGMSTLYVSIRQQHGREILSQMINVEVYSQLCLHPEYLYLTPGSSYVLSVEGGPKNGILKYASMDGKTARIEGSSGHVSAISVGNASIHATVLDKEGNMICEAYGKVQVGIPLELSLNMQSDKLCVGCEMPIFPSFEEGNLFSFYEVCSDYKWRLDNDKISTLQPPGSLHLSESDTFINVILGRSAGQTKVSVSFTCDFVYPGITQREQYNASETLEVVSNPPLALGIPITWLLPPFYTTSERLPGASNHKKGIIYSVLKACGRSDPSQDGISIIGSKIRTRESNEVTCIEARDQSTGRIEIASCVRVAEVAQVRASTEESMLHVAHLAIGSKVELAIIYCDNLGYHFSEAHGVIPLDIKTNYPNVVSVKISNDENKTDSVYSKIILEARNPGRSLLMVSAKHNPEKSVFILVSVGAQLLPQDPVIHVGSRLNFSVTKDGMDDLRSGQWLSANESVVSVNKLTGEIHAHNEGSCQVIFRGSHLRLQTTITVLKADKILVDSPSETLSNVAFPPEGYKFLVNLRSDPNEKFESSGKSFEVLFDCRVEPPFVGYAKPWSEPGSSNSYCLFFPYPPQLLHSSMSKAKRPKKHDTSEGFMYVSVIASLREAPHTEGFANALFVGGFFVKDKRELKLTPNSTRSLIKVIGNTDVEIYWSSKDLLLVAPFRVDGSGIDRVKEYKVEALKDVKFTDKLVIMLPATGQRTEIDISFEPGKEETLIAETTKASGFTWSAIAICLAILIATIIMFMKMLDRPRNVSREPASVIAGSPMSRRVQTINGTPASASAITVQSSPRTPSQPFVEYVRRTIDETPYYKRDGRRRFDPQNTY